MVLNAACLPRSLLGLPTPGAEKPQDSPRPPACRREPAAPQLLLCVPAAWPGPAATQASLLPGRGVLDLPQAFLPSLGSLPPPS